MFLATIKQFFPSWRNVQENSSRLCLLPLICTILAVLTFTLYWQVRGFGSINLDDGLYVFGNHFIRQGINLAGIKWAFTSIYADNWHPLTWISHMIDVQLFGIDPGMYHIINVFFHILNTVLLLIVLERMTGALWKSAMVAALFALHPLHVESVVWISERKDLLSTFFWMVTTMGYCWYVRNRSISRYIIIVLFYILGLMSKPMLVTLPFVFLLLDDWPLNRLNIIEIEDNNSSEHVKKTIGSDESRRALTLLIIEKIPLILCAMISCGITIYAQKSWGTVSSLNRFPIETRLANALTSYLAYLLKMLWPVNLAVFYPYPEFFNPLKVVLCALFLLIISALAMYNARKFPYLLVGWLWYIGTLVPVIGIVQVGGQSMADRYSYIPLIGCFLMIVWGAADYFNNWRHGKIINGFIAGSVLFILIFHTWIQIGYWKNSETLMRHTIAVTENNYMAHHQLGSILFSKGDLDGAIKEYRDALQAKQIAEAYQGLGNVFSVKKDIGNAIDCYSKGLQINPYDINILNSLGCLLASMGKTVEATQYFYELFKINPYNIEAHNIFGNALLRNGKVNEAIHQFNETLRLEPQDQEAQRGINKAKIIQKNSEYLVAKINVLIKTDPQNPALYTKLGDIYYQLGEYDEAIVPYKKALSVQPKFISALERLVNIHVDRQEYREALDVLQNIRQLQPDKPDVYYNTACIYAKQEKINESIYWLKQSVDKGFHDWDLLRKDPDLASIRNTSYVNELMKNH